MPYWVLIAGFIVLVVWLVARLTRGHKNQNDRRVRSMFNGFMKGRYKC